MENEAFDVRVASDRLRIEGQFVAVPVDLLKDDRLSSDAKWQFVLLRRFADIAAWKKRDIYPSISTLAGLSARSVRAVRDYLKELSEAGWLVVTERPGTSNLYELFVPDVCKNRTPAESAGGVGKICRGTPAESADESDSSSDKNSESERLAGASRSHRRSDLEGVSAQSATVFGPEEGPEGIKKAPRRPTDDALKAEEKLPATLVQRIRKLATKAGMALHGQYSTWIRDIVSKHSPGQIMSGIDALEEAARTGNVDLGTIRPWNIAGWIARGADTSEVSLDNPRPTFKPGVEVEKMGANEEPEYKGRDIERLRWYWRCRSCGQENIKGDDSSCPGCGGRIVEWVG